MPAFFESIIEFKKLNALFEISAISLNMATIFNKIKTIRNILSISFFCKGTKSILTGRKLRITAVLNFL